jgi:predicted porin
VGSVVADTTTFAVAAKYVIGPWKFYGGYEHIQYTNPDNPLAGINQGTMAFMMGGYNIAFPTNNFFGTDKVLQSFWVGAKYAVTPTLDVMGSYYGYRQNSFVSPAGNPLGNCTTSISPACSGAMDAVSVAMDWRFARHFDFYAGVMYSQKQGGLASGYVLSATNLLNPATVNTFNRVSNYDPAVGLRYQF